MRTLHVVTQTHWDREWYLPHQTSIARLLHVMTEVVEQLESGQLETFLFDGQTAAFEDLLLHAEDALITRIRSLCAAKRIVLGPWYVMADEFLCAGESLLRNLECGMADARAAGNCQMVGYMPDNFGHVSQMPQILRNFDMASAVLWRGADAVASEFDWQGADGSIVGTVFLTQGYYQHPFNVPDWRIALDKYLALIAPRTTSTNLLLTQGGDHLQPSANLADKLAAFNQAQQQYVAQPSTLEHFTKTVLQETQGKREIIAGELRHNQQAFVLPDVLSTRRYLKYLNQTAEDALLGRIEPLYAMLKLGAALPTKYIEATWRLLLQQHAHDSICGCSVDSVHAEMVTRYQQLSQRIEALQTRACAAAGLVNLAQHCGVHGVNTAAVFADDAIITLFNPSPKAFSGVSVHRVFLKGEAAKQIRVETLDGVEIAASLLSVAAGSEFHSPLDDFPDRIEGAFYEIAIPCQLGGTAALGLRIAKAVETALPTTLPTALPIASPTAPASAVIENASYKVYLGADATLNVLDKVSGKLITQALAVESTSDAGDSYNFSPPPQTTTVRQVCFTLHSTTITPHMQELTLGIEVLLPEGLLPDRNAVSPTQVKCSGTLRIRLATDETGLHCKLVWTNLARDQRTRLCIAMTGDALFTGTFSDSAFSWDTRPVRYARIPDTISRQEMPVAVEPSHSAIVAGQIYFCHRAMQEYEMQKSSRGMVLGVTMVRSVGWMSRRDLITRGVGAGPDMATPDAQCLGTEVFEFEVGVVPKNTKAASFALNRAQHLRRPIVQLRGSADCWQLPLQIDNDALQISSLRRVVDYIELRLWNPLPTAEQLSVNSAAGWKFASVYADGRAFPKAEVSSNTFVVAPFGMLTLRAVASKAAQ